MLDNKATPIHYGKFRDKVLSGEIPVCEEVSLYMNIVDDRIADPAMYYDESAINGYVKYCEEELTLTDGSPLHLIDSFKLWAEDLLSWFYFVDRSVYVPGKNGEPGSFEIKIVKKRLINKQIIVLGRGGAKSMYSSTIQSYGLNIDKSTTKGVTTAPTMKQAEEVMSPIQTSIIRSRGPLFKFLTYGSSNNTTGNKFNRPKLASTKRGIENFITGSIVEIRPMTKDKLQGLRNKYNSVDEFLSGDVREDVLGALEQGAMKIPDYIIVATSSEGTVRNGSGDDIKMEMMDILKGEYINKRVSIWWYKMDSILEIQNPALWMKAQPNLGVTVTYEDYQAEVEKMEKVPSQRNDILAKRFGIPMEGYTYFFTYEETIPFAKEQSYKGMTCGLGGDFSRGDDFCAFTFVFPLRDGAYGVDVRNYITEYYLNTLSPSMRIKYEEFINEGSLIIMTDTVLKMEDVYYDVFNYIMENEYDVRVLGYDTYNADKFVSLWKLDFGETTLEKVIQGMKTESVPLGEIKHITEQDRLIFHQSLMSFCMGNAITIEDTNGNRKLIKKRADQKIDNVSALIDAWVGMTRRAHEF